MEIDQALTAIERAKSMDGLASILVDWRSESGVAHLVYHATHVPSCEQPNPVLLLTYDDAWVKRYVEQSYFSIDPVVIAGRHAVLPIDWMTVEHATPEARHFFAEAESFGVGRHGFTLPIRGPAAERALFTVTTNAATIIGIGGGSAICEIFTCWRTTFTIARCGWRACGLIM